MLDINDELNLLIIKPEQELIDWEQYQNQKDVREVGQCHSIYMHGWINPIAVRCQKTDGHDGKHIAHGVIWPTILERRRM